jgi:hypothetical protein
MENALANKLIASKQVDRNSRWKTRSLLDFQCMSHPCCTKRFVSFILYIHHRSENPRGTVRTSRLMSTPCRPTSWWMVRHHHLSSLATQRSCIEPALAAIAAALLQRGCADCGHAGENWLCLGCYGVFCSRYVNGHASAHHDQSHHAINCRYRTT